MWWNFFLGLDQQLIALVAVYGELTLVILLLVVFLESGIVLTPFFPGDSLLFAAGAIAATGALSLSGILLLAALAAVAGGIVNYSIGYWVGGLVFKQKQFWLKQKYLHQAHKFYERHGHLAILVARFMPIIRTYVPFVAGVVRMSYPRFLAYNIIGALLWVGLFVLGGYYFGSLPLIQNNFNLVIVAIILISLLPAGYEWYRLRRA
jgi:membrane-associated protein